MASQYPSSQADRHPMKLVQSFSFEAAHRLPAVPPEHRCYKLHGHSYRVDLQLSGPVDPTSAFVVDFFDIEHAFKPVLAMLDHQYLNEIDGLQNPTGENIAVWIWGRIKPALPLLSAIVVYE